jgi:hypothetical protein
MTRTLNDLLAPALQGILDAELAHGNEISEVTDWPPVCELLVILRKPFHESYLPLANVEYAHINDSHYWKAEYRVMGGKQTLACGFS